MSAGQASSTPGRPPRGRSLYADAWRRLRRDRVAMICLWIIVAYTLLAIACEAGLLFSGYQVPVGDGWSLKQLPPGTRVYERTTPEGREEFFPGRPAAVAALYAPRAGALPEGIRARWVQEELAAWGQLPEPLRGWILSQGEPRKEALISGGPLAWVQLETGGGVRVAAGELELATPAEGEDLQGALQGYLARSAVGLGSRELAQLSAAAERSWRMQPAWVRGWIETRSVEHRTLLVRGGPPVWRALGAGELPRPPGEGRVDGLEPGELAERLAASLEERWEARAPAVRGWLLAGEGGPELLSCGPEAWGAVSVHALDAAETELQAAGLLHLYTFWCGSDYKGRDVLALIVQGSRISMKVGLISSVIAIPIGLLLGALAGYFGGRIDDLIVWFYTTLSCVPGLLLIMALAWAIGGGLVAVYISLGVTTWVQLCRLVRGEFFKLRELDYVVAAQALGAGARRIIFRHMVPNVMHIVIITFSLRFVFAILTEVILSYIGVGVDPTEPSWGRLINQTQQEFVNQGHWWIMTFTTLAMFFLVLALNVFGDALRDALDPRLKRQ